MATSIFTKLSNQSRHKKIFDDLIDPENPPGNPRKVDTVASLADFSLQLMAKCRGCGGRAAFDAAALTRLFGADTPIRNVRFGCKTCGSRAIDLLPTSSPESTTGAFEAIEAPPAPVETKPETEEKPVPAKGGKKAVKAKTKKIKAPAKAKSVKSAKGKTRASKPAARKAKPAAKSGKARAPKTAKKGPAKSARARALRKKKI